MKRPLVAKSGKKQYQMVRVREEIHGGWNRCKGPFTEGQALSYGIDTADCEHNCYTRLDQNGSEYTFVLLYPIMRTNQS